MSNLERLFESQQAHGALWDLPYSDGFQDDYASILMEEAHADLERLIYQKNDAAFCEDQGRALPKRGVLTRTLDNVLFSTALAESEEIRLELGIEDATCLGETLLELIEDPCWPRDLLLGRVQDKLGYSEGQVRKAYREAARRVSSAQIECATPLPPKPPQKDDRSAVYRVIDKALAALPREVTDLKLNQAVIGIAKRSDFDRNAKDYLVGQIAANTYMGKTAARETVKDAEKIVTGAKRPKARKGHGVIVLGDHRADSDAAYKIMTTQGDDPDIFQNGGRMTEVLEDENGNIRIGAILKPRFKGGHLEERIDFYRETAKATYNTSAPDALVNRVYEMPLACYPSLYRITSFPTYSKELALVMDPGFHTESGLYHKPKSGIDIPPVPEFPTKEEVEAARDVLVDLFADFPLDGMTRAEIEDAVANGEPVPSLAHTLSVPLTPIMRDAINGPTPNHLGRKDKPRSGATLLMSAASCVGTLEPAAPQPLPENRAEVQKTLTAIIDSGEPFAFFDNLPKGETTESDELAAAMTAYPEYTGRRLGVTGMVKGRVTQTWLTSGNRTQLSEQLRERTLLIDVDPKMERPGERPDNLFKYVPLVPHIQDNAGRYIHALLTLVQNWKAKGCPPWKGQALGGFEDHARVVGGILDAAGIFGFMGNRDKLRAKMAVAEDPETELLDAMIEEHHRESTLFRIWGADAPPDQIKNDAGDLVPFEYARHRVVSVRELLVREQIAIKHWGYDFEDGDIIYRSKSKAKMTYHFGAMEGTTREWRDAQTEDAAMHGRYVLVKVHKDNRGNLYRLDQLELIGH